MCAAEGAALATINDGYDEAFVETLMLNSGYQNVWIGLQQDQVTLFRIIMRGNGRSDCCNPQGLQGGSVNPLTLGA